MAEYEKHLSVELLQNGEFKFEKKRPVDFTGKSFIFPSSIEKNMNNIAFRASIQNIKETPVYIDIRIQMDDDALSKIEAHIDQWHY